MNREVETSNGEDVIFTQLSATCECCGRLFDLEFVQIYTDTIFTCPVCDQKYNVLSSLAAIIAPAGDEFAADLVDEIARIWVMMGYE